MLFTVFKTYLVLINALALVLMHADKKRARRRTWRIPEASLMGIALLGGSLGAMLGMYIFRHKTKHPKFFIGLPVFLVLHIVLLVWLLPKLQ